MKFKLYIFYELTEIAFSCWLLQYTVKYSFLPLLVEIDFSSSYENKSFKNVFKFSAWIFHVLLLPSIRKESVTTRYAWHFPITNCFSLIIRIVKSHSINWRECQVDLHLQVSNSNFCCKCQQMIYWLTNGWKSTTKSSGLDSFSADCMQT